MSDGKSFKPVKGTQEYFFENFFLRNNTLASMSPQQTFMAKVLGVYTQPLQISKQKNSIKKTPHFMQRILIRYVD